MTIGGTYIDPQIVVGFFAFCGVLATTLASKLGARREASGKAQGIALVEGYKSQALLIDELQEEVSELRRNRRSDSSEITELFRRQRELETQITVFEVGIKALVDQIIQMNATPVWLPTFTRRDEGE